MVTPEQVTAYLEVSGGKYAKIESKRRTGTHQLVVKSSQKSAPGLTVYKVTRQDKSVVMAFCFKLKENMYYPVVERDPDTEKAIVKVVGPINQPFEGFPEKYLFKSGTNTEYGSLCSVAEPNQYLSVSEEVITLSSKPYLKFRISPNNQANRMASTNFGLPQCRPFCSDPCTLMRNHRRRKTGKYQQSCSNTSIHTPVPSSSGHLL
ncbi:uncharacterized protein LOC128598981 isoform X2 [Ictalurus furcatus]|nr:uncharacterized protein LOC128598981 isoform X2 [Ictalurus furcatus]